MKSSKYIVQTESTIANSKSQIMSIQSIMSSKHSEQTNQQKQRYNQRVFSINDQYSQKNFSNNVFLKQSLQQIGIRKNNLGFTGKISVNQRVAEIFKKIVYKKTRYCFQILKQFILFPDDTESSIMSISVHDPLIFTDQVLHTLLKILETKFIENKIWGFLNLSMMPYYKAATRIEQQISQIHKKTVKVHKKISFQLIKKLSEDTLSAIIPKTLKFVSSIIEQQKQPEPVKTFHENKNCLNYRLVQERINPVVQASIGDSKTEYSRYTSIKPEITKNDGGKSEQSYYHSRITKIYTPSEYEQELKRRSTTKYQTVKIEYPKKQTVAVEKINYTQNNEKNKKYNIIHYYEKSQQNHTTKSQPQISINLFNTSCNNICSQNMHCNCNYNCHVKVCCHSNCSKPLQKPFSLNQTTYSQKNIQFDKIVTNSRSSRVSSELEELQSRIHYLNFLKKLASQQQNN